MPNQYSPMNPINYGYQNPQPIPGSGGNMTQDFFVYVATIKSIAAAATNNQQLTVQADSDFEWQMTTVSGNIDGVTEPASDNIILPITVLVTDGGSGRLLQSAPTVIGSMAGSGKQPFILPVFRLFKAKSTINLAFVNFGGSQYDNIYFNLIGRKIFDVSG